MSLPEVNFVEADTNTIKAEIIAGYERAAGRSLAHGDPVRLFLESVASVIAHQHVLINDTGKMNLLAYARGDYLDHIGLLVGTYRMPAAAATAQFRVTLSAVRPDAVMIPKGTRISAAENVFFSLDQDVVVAAGATEIIVHGTCTEKGAVGNGYAPGEIKTIVDPIPYVQTMINTTRSEGGVDIERDDAFRMRIQEAPEHFSVAGPSAAYEYFAKSASALIIDVAVTSPSPGEVNVYPLLVDGGLPGDEMLREVDRVVNASDVRPLTDKVKVLAPTEEPYDLELTYYIDEVDSTREISTKAAVEQAIGDFVTWQRSKIGRDINPTELQYRIRAAGAKRVAVTSPQFVAVGETSIGVIRGKQITYGGLEHD